MSAFEFSKENIYELIDKVKSAGIDEICVKNADFAVCIKGERKKIYREPNRNGKNVNIADNTVENDIAPDLQKVIRAPLVGTFYDSPSPDKPAFVSVGSSVKTGDVLCIIESMKLMNEIKSDCDGVIDQILVKPGDPVDFDQPIIILK